MPDVYGTARGRVRARLASPVAARARARRHAHFFAATGLQPGMRVVDVGCGTLGLRGLEPELDITGVDRVERPQYPGPFVLADATRRLPFDDGEFDLAYASSVIEHIEPAARPAFAAEVRRVARGWFVQTPAWSFPIEPHALLPAAHWPPAAVRRPYWRPGQELARVAGGGSLGVGWPRCSPPRSPATSSQGRRSSWPSGGIRAASPIRPATSRRCTPTTPTTRRGTCWRARCASASATRR